MNLQNGKYELKRDKVLGRGLSGQVLLAYDHEKNVYVAAKNIPAKIYQDKKELEYIENEILTSTECENENLVKVHDITEINGEKYLMIEYCNGGDLFSSLKKYREKNGKYLDEKVIQNIIKQILNGLKSLHDHVIVHNDIKPQNILLKYDNEEDLKNLNYMKCKFKIADFGLSKYKYDSQDKNIGGSPLYMEPNLFSKDVKDNEIENEKVDIWALGILTYELLYSFSPFENKDNNNSKISPIRQLIKTLNEGIYYINIYLRKNISLQIISFLNYCLQIDQAERLSSEELLFTEFITMNPDNFIYLNSDNLFDIFPIIENIADDYRIKMDIRDKKELNKKLGI